MTEIPLLQFCRLNTLRFWKLSYFVFSTQSQERFGNDEEVVSFLFCIGFIAKIKQILLLLTSMQSIMLLFQYYILRMQNQPADFKKQTIQSIDIHNHLSNTPKPQIVSIHSEYYQEYLHSMASYEMSVEYTQSIKLKLKDQNIIFDQRYFEPKFDAQLFDHTSNFQALLFRVAFGFFKMEISVLNVDSLSQSHNFYQISQNSVGSVFLYEDWDAKKYSIKCIHLITNDFGEIIKSVIKEVCILKIAHLLGVGPKTTDLFGFDIVVYNNCAEFAMEYCKKCQQFTDFDRQKIYKKAALMHRFNLVHLDIKPANVMSRTTQKEIVFIDFGLSKHIRERVGFKSTVRFSGSLSYCSKEMRRAYQSEQLQNIDLYYNDIVCLQKTIDELSQEKQSKIIKQTQNQDQKQQYMIMIFHYSRYYRKANIFFTFTRVKYFIFKQIQFQTRLINNIDFISTYYYVLTDFIKLFKAFPNLRFARYVRYICVDIERQNSVRYSTFDFTFLKEIMVLNEQTNFQQQNQQETHFLKVTKSLIGYSQEYKNSEFSFRKKEIHQFQWLLNQQTVKQFKDKDYLIKCYAHFNDFTMSYSTFQEKVQSSKIIMRKLKIQLNNEQEQTIILSKCQKSLLLQLAQTKKPYFEEVIPIFLRNLLILNSISCAEVVEVIKVVLGQSIDNVLKFKLLIRIELILLLLENENFQDFGQNVVDRMFYSVFHIKMEEPYKSIIAKLSVSFFGAIFKNYSKIKEIVAGITKGLYLQQRFIEQLIIWQFSYIFLDTKLETKHFEWFYWPRLEFIEIYVKKYNIMFDFYEFPLVYFPNQAISQKIRSKIYLNMSKCLDRQTLLKRFLIYYFQNNKRIRRQKIQNQIVYYSQLSIQLIQRFEKQMSQQNKLWPNINFLLDKRQNCILAQLATFSIKNQYLTQVQPILLRLRKIITQDILKQLIAYSHQSSTDQNNDIYKTSLGSLVFTLVCFIYQNIYKKEPGLPKEIQHFCQEIGKQILEIKFEERLMQIHFQYSLLIIKIKALELENQKEKIVYVYYQFITKYLSSEPETFINSDFFNRPFLVYIIRSYYLQPKAKAKQALKFYFQTVIKYNRFKSLFSLSTFQQSCKYLNIYTLDHLNVKSFLELHISLCNFFQLYPYDNYVRDYIRSFEKLKLIPELQNCWLYLKQEVDTYLRIKNKYIAILYAFLLTLNTQSIQKVNKYQNFTKKVQVFITKRVLNLNLNARYFILGHLYSYLYLVDSSKIFYNRRYLRFTFKKRSYGEFKRVINLTRKKKKTQVRKETDIFQSKFKRWFQILNN